MVPAAIARWHAFVSSRNAALLDELLADDVVFHSPVVHTPQAGRRIVTKYLTTAMDVLGNSSFRYVREVFSEREAVLEFVVEVEGILMNGVDIIAWNADERIVEFKVMIRPLKAIQLIHRKMAEALASPPAGGSPG